MGITYDAIIVGGGLAGLSCAAILAKNGKRIILFEKNNIVGGRCSSYKKKGFIIDYGTHVFTRTEFGPIGVLLSEINESVEFYHLRRMPFYYLRKEGKVGPFGIDIDTKYGSILPPDEEFKKLNFDKEDFKDLLNKLSKTTNMELEETYKYDNIPFFDWYEKNKEVLNIGEGVKGLLFSLYSSGLCLLVEEGSTGEFMRIMKNNSSSSIHSMLKKEVRALGLGYPKGACIAVPNAIERAINKFGGKIIKNTIIDEIILEDGEVKGVITDKGETYQSKIVISNIGPKETIIAAGKQNFQKKFLSKIDSLKESVRGYVLKVALDEPVTDEAFLFGLASNIEKSSLIMKEARLPEIPWTIFVPVVSNMDPSLAPKGKQLMIPAHGTYGDTVKYPWHKLSEKILESLEIIFPHIQNKISFYDEFGAVQAKTLWKANDGAIIRVAQIPGQVGEDALPSKTPIKGLYLVGTGIGTGISEIGVDYAIRSGSECAKDILKNEK
ncbi:MAG: NAD(P)/FAD-dependent oxidoreductase [Candidatus Lokiarchaeota archaeon]|nr:NAD(P)/FAD-dependent oxidoreductase [Candidatus Lokiarchaeota archaeon]